MATRHLTFLRAQADNSVQSLRQGIGKAFRSRLLLYAKQPRRATIQSGRKRHVRFRRGCNRHYRQTAQQFAKASVPEAEWAAAYLSRCLARGHSKSHAYRCLANRWLGIIWKLWQSRELYDETYHLQQSGDIAAGKDCR